MSDLFAFRGVTDGANATGTFDLLADQLEVAVAYIEIDKGMAAKIWMIEVDGATVDVIIQYTPDDTADPIVWRELKRVDHATAGHLRAEKYRKPLMVEAKNDTTRMRVNWADSAPAVSYLTMTVEFDDIK